MTNANTIWRGTMRMRSSSVLRHASLKFTSANMRWKLSRVSPPLSAITERSSAWTIGMTIKRVRNAMVGRRSANGRNRSVRVRISSLSPPLLFRSLHLAGAARRSVGTPALDVAVVHRLLNDRRLLVEHGLNGLVRRRLRDTETYHDAHVVAALRAGGRGNGHEVVRLRLEDVDEPSDVVDAEPDITRLKRLLEPRVSGRLRIRVLPELLHVVPHRRSVRALVCRDEAAGVRGIEVALNEAVNETVRGEGEPEFLLPG